MNYEETLQYIHSRGMFSLPAGLDRIRRVMALLGDPQNNCPVIHIAGTNGKGSTAAMTASTLRAAGYKTGLFISPYIIEFRERIQVDGVFISEEELCVLTAQVTSLGIELTEFELITAVAFLHFARERCDAVVLETGLGGRLDATNVSDTVRVSVITKIGMDHTAILGDTVAQIAAEKCGIIRNGVTVTIPGQPAEAMRVIEKAARRLIVPDKNELTVKQIGLAGNEFDYRGVSFRTLLGGAYQIDNALTAIETVRNSGFAVSDAALQEGLRYAAFPARLETVHLHPLTVLDGAHNPDGAAVLREAMLPYAGRITAIVGAMRDKNVSGVLEQTLPLCHSVITVRASEHPRALSAEALAAIAKPYCGRVIPAASHAGALRLAREYAAGDPIFIFGSLYLASALRPLLLNDGRE